MLNERDKSLKQGKKGEGSGTKSLGSAGQAINFRKEGRGVEVNYSIKKEGKTGEGKERKGNSVTSQYGNPLSNAL